MRLSWSMLILSVAVGCSSNWKTPPGDEDWPDPFASNPAWPDCDGDGLGDPTVAPVCIDFDQVTGANDPQFCDQPPVRNGVDCDDTFALSGALLGTSCPDDFSWLFEGTVPDYQTITLGGREFLIWSGSPVHYNTATMICESWGTLGSDVTDESGSVATLNGDFQLGEMTSQVTQIYGEWRGWVGLNFDTETGEWMWLGDTTGGQAGIPFCDGEPFTPEDVVSPASLDPAFDDELQDVISEVFVLLEFADGQRCLRNPRSEEHCDERGACLEADLMCEREAVTDSLLQVFELGDLECGDTTE